MKDYSNVYGNPKILVVEDDETQLELLTEMIQDEGIDVVACSCGLEAMQQLNSHEFDVAVVDLNLPDLKAEQFLEALVPFAETASIIINTGFASYESARDALNIGIFAYVEKAGDPNSLLRHIHRACHARLRRYSQDLEKAVEERTRALRQANKKLKSLASELTLTEERLRRNVATQLHDTVSQTLAMAKVQVASLREQIKDAHVHQALCSVHDSLDRVLLDSRTLTAQLCFPTLDILGFEKAVKNHLEEEIQSRCGLHTVFQTDGHPKPLDQDVRAVLFRGVREILTNVSKHAQAQAVEVSLQRLNNTIVVAVKDDGKGCDLTRTGIQSGGFGILSIDEALNRLGGQLILDSAPGAGYKVTMIAPLKTE